MLKILPNQIRMPNQLSFEGTGLESIIKWETRRDWMDDKIASFAAEEVPDGWKLYERDYQLDMHRWIARQLAKAAAVIPDFDADSDSAESVDAFKLMVRSFAEKNGDFFTNDVIANTTEQNIKQWFKEWEFIGSWDFVRADSSFERSDLMQVIQRKLNRYTSAEIIAKRKGADNYDVAIRPNSWAGWCWALIARDFYDGITYELCINYDTCGREVASLTLKGNKTNKCSDRCKKAAYRKKKTGKEIGAVAAAFEALSDVQEKGVQIEEKR